MEPSRDLPARLLQPSILDLSEEEIEALAVRYREEESRTGSFDEKEPLEAKKEPTRADKGGEAGRPTDQARVPHEPRPDRPQRSRNGDARKLASSRWLELFVLVLIAGFSLYLLIRPNCNIKGNISFRTGERIYHMPGDAFYKATVIDRRAGERWFCSEEQAQRAGWRRTYR
jgi:hypothetical protein